MKNKIKLCSFADLTDLFHQEISDVNDIYKFNIPDPIIAYLIDLLLDTTTKPPSLTPTLFDMYKESFEADTKQLEFTICKNIGDKALIFSGYFPDSVESRGVTNYYIEMGAAGYYRSYSLIDNLIYFEMSKRYQDLVKILNEVSETNRNPTMDELLKLYSEWLSTKNPAIGRKLIRHGLIIQEVEE